MAINLPIVSKFYDKGVKNAEKSLKDFGAFAAKTAAAATAAVAGIAVFSVKKFADFDSALNKSIAIMGDVSDTLQTDMADTARDVAKSTTFSAEEAAEAYFFLASAGLDAEASIAAMPQVAKFAQAGMFDMALATDLATDAQSALGLTSDDAAENLENLTRVTDVFVKANTLANTSVEQLASAFTSKAGNALKTVGKDVEEGAAALAVFADQGIKGERAGTLLTNTIFGLTDRVGAVPEKFDALGISIFDAEGNMKNFSEISDQFTGVLGTMTTEQKIATLSQLGFTKQSREGLLALVGNSEALSEYEDALRDAGGTVDDVSQKQLDTFNGKMDLMKSRLEDVAIEIGGALAPKLGEMVDAMAPIIDQAAPVIIELFDKMWGALENIGSFLKPLIDESLPGFKTMFDNLKGPVESVLGFLTTLGETVLVAVKDLITSEPFQKAFERIAASVGDFAKEAKRLVESELGAFLIDVTKFALISGMNLMATAVQKLADGFRALNSALDALSGKSYDFQGLLGGLSAFGIPLGNVLDKLTGGKLSAGMPKLANGGIIPARAGGTHAIIGEAGQAEAVIPLNKLEKMTSGGGNSYSINVNAGMGSDGRSIGKLIVDEIVRFEKSSGRVFARA